MFLSCTNESKTGFNTRKWNYPNRKWNDFSDFLSSNQKTSFTKFFLLLLTSLKQVLKKGNRIIQTGNGIISPTSWPPIKKLLLFLLFPDFRLKNFFYKMFLSFNNDTKNGFENRKWNYCSYFNLHNVVNCVFFNLK